MRVRCLHSEKPAFIKDHFLKRIVFSQLRAANDRKSYCSESAWDEISFPYRISYSAMCSTCSIDNTAFDAGTASNLSPAPPELVKKGK